MLSAAFSLSSITTTSLASTIGLLLPSFSTVTTMPVFSELSKKLGIEAFNSDNLDLLWESLEERYNKLDGNIPDWFKWLHEEIDDVQKVINIANLAEYTQGEDQETSLAVKVEMGESIAWDDKGDVLLIDKEEINIKEEGFNTFVQTSVPSQILVQEVKNFNLSRFNNASFKKFKDYTVISKYSKVNNAISNMECIIQPDNSGKAYSFSVANISNEFIEDNSPTTHDLEDGSLMLAFPKANYNGGSYIQIERYSIDIHNGVPIVSKTHIQKLSADLKNSRFQRIQHVAPITIASSKDGVYISAMAQGDNRSSKYGADGAIFVLWEIDKDFNIIHTKNSDYLSKYLFKSEREDKFAIFTHKGDPKIYTLLLNNEVYGGGRFFYIQVPINRDNNIGNDKDGNCLKIGPLDCKPQKNDEIYSTPEGFGNKISCMASLELHDSLLVAFIEELQQPNQSQKSLKVAKIDKQQWPLPVKKHITAYPIKDLSSLNDISNINLQLTADKDNKLAAVTMWSDKDKSITQLTFSPDTLRDNNNPVVTDKKLDVRTIAEFANNVLGDELGKVTTSPSVAEDTTKHVTSVSSTTTTKTTNKPTQSSRTNGDVTKTTTHSDDNVTKSSHKVTTTSPVSLITTKKPTHPPRTNGDVTKATTHPDDNVTKSSTGNTVTEPTNTQGSTIPFSTNTNGSSSVIISPTTKAPKPVVVFKSSKIAPVVGVVASVGFLIFVCLYLYQRKKQTFLPSYSFRGRFREFLRCCFNYNSSLTGSNSDIEMIVTNSDNRSTYSINDTIKEDILFDQNVNDASGSSNLSDNSENIEDNEDIFEDFKLGGGAQKNNEKSVDNKKSSLSQKNTNKISVKADVHCSAKNKDYYNTGLADILKQQLNLDDDINDSVNDLEEFSKIESPSTQLKGIQNNAPYVKYSSKSLVDDI